jgi:hypothetical protein
MGYEDRNTDRYIPYADRTIADIRIELYEFQRKLESTNHEQTKTFLRLHIDFLKKQISSRTISKDVL